MALVPNDLDATVRRPPHVLLEGGEVHEEGFLVRLRNGTRLRRLDRLEARPMRRGLPSDAQVVSVGYRIIGSVGREYPRHNRQSQRGGCDGYELVLAPLFHSF